jgi:hypothetical protein
MCGDVTGDVRFWNVRGECMGDGATECGDGESDSKS